MKAWIYAMVVVSAGSLAACSSSSSSTTGSSNAGTAGTSADGGGGAGGGGAGAGGTGGAMGGAGGTPTTTISAGGSTMSGMMTTGTMSTGSSMSVCDNTGVCQDMDMNVTNDCVSCATVGPCKSDVDACNASADCCGDPMGNCTATSLVGCFKACMQGDNACIQKCAQSHPQGAMLYLTYEKCVICENCQSSCPTPAMQLMCQ